MHRLNSPEEFKAYCNNLDKSVAKPYRQDHIGTPNRYPCVVFSEWGDDPNGSCYYRHSFIYTTKCPKCGELLLPDDASLDI